MVHHICFLELKASSAAVQIEHLMVETRIRLLKLGEVSNLRVGKRIDTQGNPHALFFSFDTETMDKLKFIEESAIYTQFEKQILHPYVSKAVSWNYEMEPGKDVRYS